MLLFVEVGYVVIAASHASEKFGLIILRPLMLEILVLLILLYGSQFTFTVGHSFVCKASLSQLF